MDYKWSIFGVTKSYAGHVHFWYVGTTQLVSKKEHLSLHISGNMCCIFGPANECCALHLQVQILFFHISPLFCKFLIDFNAEKGGKNSETR